MGACIVCGKSAGLFYRLHKLCYAYYQELLKTLPADILAQLQDADVDDVQEVIRKAFSASPWQSRCRQDLLTRILQESAWQLLKAPPDHQRCSAKLAELFDINEITLDDPQTEVLLQKLKNLPLVQQLKETDELPLDPELQSRFPFSLDPQERVIWQFPLVRCGVRQALAQQLPRSSLERVFDIITGKHHPQPVQTHLQGEGELWLTTIRMEYCADEDHETVYVQDIQAVTPLQGGVRIQLSLADSVAKDYLCGDGELMYTLLKRVCADSAKYNPASQRS